MYPVEYAVILGAHFAAGAVRKVSWLEFLGHMLQVIAIRTLALYFEHLGISCH